MQLHTAKLDKSGSHINFTCRWNKSTVAVILNYILLYFEELPECFRCALGKLRPQHAQEFGFVLYNYDISNIRNLLHGQGSDASNTVEILVHIDNRNTEFRISDTIIYVTKTPELQRRSAEKECSNILYVTIKYHMCTLQPCFSIYFTSRNPKKATELTEETLRVHNKVKIPALICHVGYVKKSTANLKLIDNLIDSPDTSIVYGEMCWMTWLKNKEASGLKQWSIVCLL
jgi:hypothetical protein